MNQTKLKHLQKNDYLSQWQQNQRSLGHKNKQFFLTKPTIDPWEKDRREKYVIESQIPSLANLKSVSWGPRHRHNKDINQQLENQRIMKSQEYFRK